MTELLDPRSSEFRCNLGSFVLFGFVTCTTVCRLGIGCYAAPNKPFSSPGFWAGYRATRAGAPKLGKEHGGTLPAVTRVKDNASRKLCVPFLYTSHRQGTFFWSIVPTRYAEDGRQSFLHGAKGQGRMLFGKLLTEDDHFICQNKSGKRKEKKKNQ